MNNIPIEKCTKRGIVVSNTPGANANAVKELVAASMLILARNIHAGLRWTHKLSQTGAQSSPVSVLVEQEKKRFVGSELYGKTVGIIGLGAIGQRVANMCISLGMNALGYDPYLSVDGALRLSRAVKRELSLQTLCANADYITVHVPYLKDTHHLLNAQLLKQCKPHSAVLNFARAELVDDDAMLAALGAGIIRIYATDFPSERLLKHSRVLCIPHLGASTEESEQNCAFMACEQIVGYLERGAIINSVNFPSCELELSSGVQARLLISNHNKQGVVAHITSALETLGCNIENMINKHKNETAYNIIDVNRVLSEPELKKLSDAADVIHIRQLEIKV